MRINLSLTMSVGLITANILFAHYFVLNGILFTPIVITVIAFIIGNLTIDLKPFWKSLLIVTFIAIHDIRIKLYAGGTHDREGAAWILLFMLLGSVIAFCFLNGAIIKDKKEALLHKLTAIVVYPALLFLHIYFSQDIGF